MSHKPYKGAQPALQTHAQQHPPFLSSTATRSMETLIHSTDAIAWDGSPCQLLEYVPTLLAEKCVRLSVDGNRYGLPTENNLWSLQLPKTSVLPLDKWYRKQQVGGTALFLAIKLPFNSKYNALVPESKIFAVLPQNIFFVEWIKETISYECRVYESADNKSLS